jgi:hypothetical protein
MERAQSVTMRTRIVLVVVGLLGCAGEVGGVVADAPVRAALDEASGRSGVPVSVLASVGFFGMQLTMPGEQRLDGEAVALLSGDVVARAAAASGLEAREVETTLRGQLLGTAALLRELRAARLAATGVTADD